MTNENETSLPASRLALANILDNNEEILEPMDAEEGAAVATDDEELQQQHKTALDGYCVECDGKIKATPAVLMHS